MDQKFDGCASITKNTKKPPTPSEEKWQHLPLTPRWADEDENLQGRKEGRSSNFAEICMVFEFEKSNLN